MVAGALEHKDSMGNGSVIRPGELQLMRAGTGVTHSEYNHSASELVHFLQIWVIPDQEGLEPAYDQRAFSEEERRASCALHSLEYFASQRNRASRPAQRTTDI